MFTVVRQKQKRGICMKHQMGCIMRREKRCSWLDAGSRSVTPGSGKALCSTEPSYESNEITPTEKASKCLSQTHHWHFHVTMNTTDLGSFSLASYFCSGRCFLCTFRTNTWAVTINRSLFIDQKSWIKMLVRCFWLCRFTMFPLHALNTWSASNRIAREV